MKKFAKDLRTLSVMIINFEEKEMISLTHNENIYHEKQKYCHICKRKFYNDENDKRHKKYHKVRDDDHYAGIYRGAAHSDCNLRYNEQHEIPIISHNGCNYDYHFMINKLATEFKGNIDCLGENTEKYKTFEVSPKKIKESNKLITHKLKFIDFTMNA